MFVGRLFPFPPPPPPPLPVRSRWLWTPTSGSSGVRTKISIFPIITELTRAKRQHLVAAVLELRYRFSLLLQKNWRRSFSWWLAKLSPCISELLARFCLCYTGLCVAYCIYCVILLYYCCEVLLVIVFSLYHCVSVLLRNGKVTLRMGDTHDQTMCWKTQRGQRIRGAGTPAHHLKPQRLLSGRCIDLVGNDGGAETRQY